MIERMHAYIVVCEHAINELTFFGPFSSMLEAETWMECLDDNGVSLWIAPVNYPDN